ncbi:MAG: DNA gyrase inhibitor YacG [Rhodoferax sp.]|uniref:DNA gyrase inhibitor YacG n=1 Tax=Rhodoferax sp. TaxID=50421 RepID=UPI00261EA30C|nr:DNA gyrase inhibitor YacG [Rhodoferax sp.]MDD5336171.1 DNA gyrase inhibitor YacG [Rhodoferax sp.]
MKTASAPRSGAAKRVTCPTCGGDSVYASSNPYRPFCSERCKNIDLGAWASENFRLPVSKLPEDQVTDEPRSSASH